jgi:hypothetical protein
MHTFCQFKSPPSLAILEEIRAPGAKYPVWMFQMKSAALNILFGYFKGNPRYRR